MYRDQESCHRPMENSRLRILYRRTNSIVNFQKSSSSGAWPLNLSSPSTWVLKPQIHPWLEFSARDCPRQLSLSKTHNNLSRILFIHRFWYHLADVPGSSNIAKQDPHGRREEVMLANVAQGMSVLWFVRATKMTNLVSAERILKSRICYTICFYCLHNSRVLWSE